MSGNPLHSFGASDSGILDAFSGMLPKPARLDEPAVNGSQANGQHGSLCGDESAEASAAGPTDAEITAMLRQSPLPADFLKRLHQAADRF